MFSMRCAIGALLLSLGLQAAPIPGLYNTGVDTNGAQVTDADGISDPHWLQGGNTAYTYNINRSTGFSIYIPETLTGVGSDRSRWISLDGLGGPGGNYTVPFTIEFDLTGYLPGTASIAGRWATDNCGSASLNGGAAFSSIGNCASSASFTSWTPFSVNSGFAPGVNTLTFNLTNSNASGSAGASAIRVEFLESNAVAEVPEPATFALLGGALLLGGLMRRKR